MRKHVVCLYEQNGFSALDWAREGYDVYCYDILTQKTTVRFIGQGRIIFMHWDARDAIATAELIERHKGQTALTLAFPPCDDLDVSGAGWFASKAEKDPDFQKKAMELVFIGRDVAEALEAPYAIENPVSRISSLWRKPDHTFHPYEYGGYLPSDDQHPLFPEYIAPRDAYPKKTCYWTGNGFSMPLKKPVSAPDGYSQQHKKLGGKSAKTKRIRSMSPRGIARAIFEVHHNDEAI